MRMRKKRWLIPLLVLFIGIILPTKTHAMELKDTDESVVKWDTVQTKTTTLSDTDTLYDYTFEKESYNSYQEAVKDIAKYAIDLVADRKSEHFQGYIPFEIKTTEDISTLKTSDVENQVKQWMMFGNDVTKHEILSFSYSRSGGYENLRSFYTYVTKFSKTDTGYEGIIRVSVNYRFDKDFFQKYETGVQNAVKDMDVAGKSDYDKAYAVCKWIQRKIKYEPGKYDQSGMYAMVNKEAVCNGKAELACYIGRCVGIDTLYVGGNSDDDHAWNLMKIDGEWYYVDPTTGPDSATFLQGTDYIQTSFREVKYKDEDGPSDDEISPYSYNVMHSSCNGEHEWVKSFTRNPGCTKKGYDVYKCKKCKNSKFINFVEPLGHDYTKVKVVQEATCTKPEISEFICSRYDDDISHTNPCDGTYSYTKKEETAPALGHDWKDNGDGTATCQRDGCGETHTHIWKKTGTVAATCTDTGKTEYTCTVCGQTKTTTIKALGHKYETVSTDDATCTTPKTVHKECTRCHDKKDETSGEALGHNWRTSSDKNSKTCIRCKTTHIHTWDEGKYSVEPTCKDAGKKFFTCTDCGDTKTVAVKSLGHDYQLVRTDPATCTTPAINHYACSRCGDTVDQEDKDHPALGHDWKKNDDGTVTCQRCGQTHEHKWNTEVISEASCTTDGVTRHTCSICGDTYDDVVKGGHKWTYKKTGTNTSVCLCTVCGKTKEHDFSIFSDKESEKKAPTCTKAGMVVATCADCGRRRWVYDETRPALGHDWKDNGDGTATCQREGCGKSHTHTLDEGEVTKKPSCEEKGVKTYRCTETNCNYTKTEDIAATGHNWNDGKITTKASCDHTGVKIYTCKTCGDTRTETIAMLEHTWDDGQVTTKPSCTEKGIRTYTCNVCKETKTEELEATGHQHTEIRGKKDATCTETGYTGDTYCKDCDTKLSDGKEIPATGHQNKEVRDKKAATCTKAGYTGDTYCKDCGELLKTGKETDALGHTWGKGKVTRKSTYTAAGQITYTCSRCGEKRVITTKKLFYPKAGTKYTVAGCQYKVIKAGAEVSLVGTNKNAKSVTIPAVIKVKGVTYKVTSIGTKAFNGSKKLTKVTIGANIKKISNNAFFKCKSLKMVNIKSVLLTKKTANKKAFKGTNKKMVIKVPKKVKKAYVKMFKGLKVK